MERLADCILMGHKTVIYRKENRVYYHCRKCLYTASRKRSTPE